MQQPGLALTRLEARVSLVDNIDLAFAAHNAAIFVTGFEGPQRASDFH